jgi:hypothetical protein
MKKYKKIYSKTCFLKRFELENEPSNSFKSDEVQLNNDNVICNTYTCYEVRMYHHKWICNTYTCYEVRMYHHKWKEEFRKKNGVNELRHDKFYDAFCSEIDNFLNKCKCIPDEYKYIATL